MTKDPDQRSEAMSEEPMPTQQPESGFDLDDVAWRWGVAGFGPEEAEYWADVCSGPDEAEQWMAVGFRPCEAAEWATTGLFPDEAAEWRKNGFEPDEVAEWDRAWPDPVVCAEWRDGQFSPEEMLKWITALNGLVQPEDQFDTARRWTIYGFKPREAVRWLRAGFARDEAGLASEWEGRGGSPEDMIEWTAALGGLVQDEAPFDTARRWTFYGFKPSEAVRWLQAGFEWDEADMAAAWNDRGFSIEEAGRLRSEGLGPDEAAARRSGAT